MHSLKCLQSMDEYAPYTVRTVHCRFVSCAVSIQYIKKRDMHLFSSYCVRDKMAIHSPYSEVNGTDSSVFGRLSGRDIYSTFNCSLYFMGTNICKLLAKIVLTGSSHENKHSKNL